VHRAHAVMRAGLFAHSRMLPPEQSEMRQIAPNAVIETHVGRLEGVGLRPDGRSHCPCLPRIMLNSGPICRAPIADASFDHDARDLSRQNDPALEFRFASRAYQRDRQTSVRSSGQPSSIVGKRLRRGDVSMP
jgi:hypothetical protein